MAAPVDPDKHTDSPAHVILEPPPHERLHGGSRPSHPRIAEWQLITWLGAAFAVVGTIDILLAWFPARFSSAEWEFATTTLTFNALPVPILGLALMLAAGLAQSAPRLTRSVAVGFVVVALFVLVAGFIFATVLPMALKANPGSIAQETVRKAAIKSFAQIAIYLTFSVYAAMKAWRA